MSNIKDVKQYFDEGGGGAEKGGGYHMKVATLGTDTDNYSNYTLDKFHVRLP